MRLSDPRQGKHFWWQFLSRSNENSKETSHKDWTHGKLHKVWSLTKEQSVSPKLTGITTFAARFEKHHFLREQFCLFCIPQTPSISCHNTAALQCPSCWSQSLGSPWLWFLEGVSDLAQATQQSETRWLRLEITKAPMNICCVENKTLSNEMIQAMFYSLFARSNKVLFAQLFC